MRVYLAAPYAARDRVRLYRDELTRLGVKVTSSWLHESHDINDGTIGAATALDDDTVSKHAVQDFDDIRYSDLLVLFTEKAVDVDRSTGGRHVETGYALALGKPIIVVGEPENVFHRIRGGHSVTVISDWHETVIEIAARALHEERTQPREDVAS